MYVFWELMCRWLVIDQLLMWVSEFWMLALSAGMVFPVQIKVKSSAYAWMDVLFDGIWVMSGLIRMFQSVGGEGAPLGAPSG